jgi:Flp pilus assembly pilin Flp
LIASKHNKGETTMRSLYTKYLDLKTRLTQEEEGQTVIEYALLLVLIALALLAANPNITQELTNVFSKVTSGLQIT